MNKLVALTLVAICSFTFAAWADISPEKKKEIEKLLKLTGVEKLAAQMENQMLANFKTQMPQVPEVFWTKYREKMDTHELIEKMMPVYDKYYTIDDLKAVNAFYESPAGQKLLATLPQVMQEAMQIGQAWGQKIGKEAADEADKEMKKK